MSDNPTFDRINEEINDTDVVLFMKGTPMFPQCGFSAANVLEDTEIREGIKAFSDWPTIPQMYIKGEFIGGCDIVKEMYEAGELQKMLDDKGIEYVS
jgi:monothiol glutaredoxin